MYQNRRLGALIPVSGITNEHLGEERANPDLIFSAWARGPGEHLGMLGRPAISANEADSAPSCGAGPSSSTQNDLIRCS